MNTQILSTTFPAQPSIPWRRAVPALGIVLFVATVAVMTQWVVDGAMNYMVELSRILTPAFLP